MPRRTSLALLPVLVVGPAAAATLQGFLDELRVCVAGAG